MRLDYKPGYQTRSLDLQRWAKVNGVGVGIQGFGLWGSWRGYRFSIDDGGVTTLVELEFNGLGLGQWHTLEADLYVAVCCNNH